VSAASLAALTILAAVPQAKAQWFPFGGSPPGEIVQRLQAEGYLLLGPLVRKETVYLADVKAGPRGRERLVIDAWSGEILQRFVARRGRGGPSFVPEDGEFNEPPPLGPPPARAFREETDLGPEEVPPKARAKSKPSTARRSAEPKPLAQPGEPRNAGAAGATPTAGAQNSGSPAATAPAGSPSGGPGGAGAAETPPARAPSERGKEAPPKPIAASVPPAGQTQTKAAAPPSSPAPSAGPSPAGEKPAQKKVNDVPVNPLE